MSSKKQDKMLQESEAIRRKKAPVIIDALDIKPEEILLSFADDTPYFIHISSFIEWIRSNQRKRFTEWHSCLFLTSDLLDGKIQNLGVSIFDLETHLNKQNVNAEEVDQNDKF